LLQQLLEFGDGLVDAGRDEVHVGGGKTAHADSAIAKQVDVLFLHEEFAHVRIESSERKHSDLEEHKERNKSLAYEVYSSLSLRIYQGYIRN